MTDLFTSANDQGATIDQNQDYLEVLVGEGKKFKTPQELARGKAEADLYIERLKEEAEALRKDLAARKRLEDVVDLLSKPSGNTPPDQSQNNHNGNEQHRSDATPPQDIGKLVEDALSKRDLENRQSANISEVKRTLQTAWGDSFATKVASQAEALGVTKEFLNNLAANQPKAFYKLVGLGEQAKGPDLFTAPTSQVNSGSFQPSTGNVRNKAYYDKMRKDTPSEYKRTATQVQMHKDAIALGDRFFS